MTTIYFGTNRKPNRDNNPDDFGGEFSSDGLANLRFGKAEVSGSNFNQIDIQVAQENLTVNPPILGSQVIFEELRERMAQGATDTIIFIHGFNVSFKEGLRCAAQLEEKLTTNDPIEPKNPLKLNMAVFSWPSDASLLFSRSSQTAIAYQNDRLDAKTSGTAFARGFLKLAEFINQLPSEQQCRQRLHLVAHSMGNYVLRNALQEVKNQVGNKIPRIFDQIVMTAADEDDDAFEFEHKLLSLPRLTRRTTVYFNRGDLALWASDNLKGNPTRLGTDGPIHPQQVPRNVNLIDCTRVVARSPQGPSEHGYFLSVPRVVTDMRQVLRNELPDEIPGRKFVQESNRYRLLEDLTPQD